MLVAMPDPSPFPVVLELPGWALLWARLELAAGAQPTAPAAADLAELRRQAAARARSRFELERLPEDATVAAVRALFRAAGCDPTRYRPSSEALLRRVLKGEELPVIQPLVDFNNCLSIDLAVPCSVAAEGSFTPPVSLRAGRPGEAFASLRGPFHLEGKPLLADAEGPFSTPITDSQRIKVQDDTRRAWLVAYLPAAALTPAQALAGLEELLRDLPLARLEMAGTAGTAGMVGTAGAAG
jgi:DNA/RNA-binding domain of Phe-tRNA-synthetase-like protein